MRGHGDALGALGVLPRLELRLNSLGDAASRRAFAQALREHLHSLGARADIALSPESQQRLEAGGDTAVLRILDSKHPADVAALARGGSEGTMGGAAGSSSPSPSCPALSDFLTPEASERMQRVFEGVTSSLPPERLRVVQDDRLVRGLDYYCHTAFEFVVSEEQGEEDHEEGFGGGGNNNNNNNNTPAPHRRARNRNKDADWDILSEANPPLDVFGNAAASPDGSPQPLGNGACTPTSPTTISLPAYPHQLSSLTLGHILGEGQFGDVFLAQGT